MYKKPYARACKVQCVFGQECAYSIANIVRAVNKVKVMERAVSGARLSVTDADLIVFGSC